MRRAYSIAIILSVLYPTFQWILLDIFNLLKYFQFILVALLLTNLLPRASFYISNFKILVYHIINSDIVFRCNFTESSWATEHTD